MSQVGHGLDAETFVAEPATSAHTTVIKLFDALLDRNPTPDELKRYTARYAGDAKALGGIIINDMGVKAVADVETYVSDTRLSKPLKKKSKKLETYADEDRFTPGAYGGFDYQQYQPPGSSNGYYGNLSPGNPGSMGSMGSMGSIVSPGNPGSMGSMVSPGNSGGSGGSGGSGNYNSFAGNQVVCFDRSEVIRRLNNVTNDIKFFADIVASVANV